MHEDTSNVVGWSATAGAFFATVALAFVLVLDLASTTFAPKLQFVLSSTVAVLLVGAVLWWRVVERRDALTRRRAAAVGAAVGLVGPPLAFALNPSVYGTGSNVAVALLSGVVAAGYLGLVGLIATFGLPVVLGAVTGWSLAGWLRAFRT